jgi:dTDP-4-amino-4,6-dideoxygalactose transaminase
MDSIPAAKIYFPEEDKKAILERINEVLGTGQLTLGKYCKEFEGKYASYVGTKYAMTVNSGTAALEIPLRVFGVKNSSVIVPTNTFFATPAAVIHAGGKVIFADIKDNLCLDPASVDRSIKSDTKAVIFVHIGGLVPPELEEVRKICKERDVLLIEDAAHAHGSSLNGKRAGSFGDAAAFSFYPTKVITSGEGGMITTDSDEVYKKALVFRDQGKIDFSSNLHSELGYNWRMSEVHAILGLSQFGRLEEFIEGRRRVAKIYDEGLSKLDNVTAIEIPNNSKSNYYKYCAVLKKGIDRDKVKQELKANYGVSLSGEVYTVPCHLQPVFKDAMGFKGGEFPIAEDLCSRHICLPIFPTMTDEQANRVISSLKEVVK